MGTYLNSKCVFFIYTAFFFLKFMERWMCLQEYGLLSIPDIDSEMEIGNLVDGIENLSVFNKSINF